MGEAAGAEGAVAGLAEGVVLCGDAGPVIEAVSEFVLDGEAADLPAGIAGLDADGGDSGAGAERGIVAALEEVEGFGAECGERKVSMRMRPLGFAFREQGSGYPA